MVRERENNEEHLSCRGSPSGIFLGLHSGFDISRVHRITVFDCQKFYKIRATGRVMQSSEWFSLNMFVILTFHCSRRQTKNTNKSMKTPTKPFYLAYCVFVPNASIWEKKYIFPRNMTTLHKIAFCWVYRLYIINRQHNFGFNSIHKRCFSF